MTERRPHWDDDLIEAVSSALENPFHDEMVYAIIAAVEDWQAAIALEEGMDVLAAHAAAVSEAFSALIHARDAAEYRREREYYKQTMESRDD